MLTNTQNCDHFLT